MKHGKTFLQGKFHLADSAFHLWLLCPVSSFLLLFLTLCISFNVLKGVFVLLHLSFESIMLFLAVSTNVCS